MTTIHLLHIACRSRAIASVLAVVSLVAPRAAVSDQPRITRDVPYCNSDDLQLTFDVCQPDEANSAAVLYMISGGWYSRRFDPAALFPETRREKNLFGKLIDAGFTVVLVRHRSAPQHKVPEAVADVRRATQFLRHHADEYGLDADRFGAMGGSAGGHLSLMLGTAEAEQHVDDELTLPDLATISARVQAVVAYFPPTDLRPILFMKQQFPALDFDPALAASVSPLAYVTSDDAPTLLVHGTNDRLVPILSSQAIYLAMQTAKVPVELLTLQGAGHGFRGDAANKAADAAVSWFQKQLLAESADDNS